jgi:serine protease AprX
LAVKSLGITRGVSLQKLPIMGVIATKSQILGLSRRSDVRSLWHNDQLQYENHTATAITGVQRARADATLTARNAGSAVDGSGVGVVVNDSGVDGTHLDLPFGSKVVQNVEGLLNLNAYSSVLPVIYAEGLPNTDWGAGHGTHVSGIVGGTGAASNGKYAGVAPGVKLVGYGSGVTLLILDTLGAFDYAVLHKDDYDIRVITNSWGNTGDVGTDFDPNDPVNVASKICLDNGIATVFSSGNSGAADGTVTGNFKKAPWVIMVANSEKNGILTESSSRGRKGAGGTVTIDGQTFTWEDRPTVTAPGTHIISTKASTNTNSYASSDGPVQDVETIEPEYLPFYVSLSGTSMAAPHVAGIVALLFDANPDLTPMQVKSILQQTASQMPGYEPFEVGAGLVNAYAAIDRAARVANYGTTLNINRTFNSNVQLNDVATPFTIQYTTAPEASPTGNRYTVTVPANQVQLDVRVSAEGLEGETGNTINLVLIAPDGTEYSSGVPVLFPITYQRAVLVDNPMAGDWIVELRGLRGAAENPTDGVSLPEDVNGVARLKSLTSSSGLTDIAGSPEQASILVAVYDRLVDGFSDRRFRPAERLERSQLADYLNMGIGVRQFLPVNGVPTFSDVTAAQAPFAEAVAARGAAQKDRFHQFRGVMLPAAAGSFAPRDAVRRADLAYSLVQALGLEEQALSRNGQPVTATNSNGQQVPVSDASQIPAGLEGYVQVAIDLGIIRPTFTADGSSATFGPTKVVTRGEYAQIITRYHAAWVVPE